jgi:hypothetical protein
LIAYLWPVFSYKLIYRQNPENLGNEFFNRMDRTAPDALPGSSHSALPHVRGGNSTEIDPYLQAARWATVAVVDKKAIRRAPLAILRRAICQRSTPGAGCVFR